MLVSGNRIIFVRYFLFSTFQSREGNKFNLGGFIKIKKKTHTHKKKTNSIGYYSLLLILIKYIFNDFLFLLLHYVFNVKERLSVNYGIYASILHIQKNV